MKRQQKKSPKKRSTSPSIKAQSPKPKSRRDVLRLMRNGAIALPVLAGIGYFSLQSVQATIREGDLTNIGGGKLSVVQIHDPQCPLCTTLQRQTRDALKSYDDDKFTFLVANIKKPSGADFAAKYGVPHVTLLLFDRRGDLVQVVRGPIDSGRLDEIIAAYAKAHG